MILPFILPYAEKEEIKEVGERLAHLLFFILRDNCKIIKSLTHSGM